jgi:hypothetical protein
MKPYILFTSLFFVSFINVPKYVETVKIQNGSSDVVLDSILKTGEVILYESELLCSGCIDELSAVLNKLSKKHRIFLLSPQNSSKSMRYRVNQWSKNNTQTISELRYTHCSLGLKLPSPLILIKENRGYSIFNLDDLLKPSNRINLKTLKEIRRIQKD